MESGVQQLNNMKNPIQIPQWLHLASPFTACQLKSIFLQYCQTVTAGGIFSNFVIAPNSLAEYSNIIDRISGASRDPFFIALANAIQNPIAEIYFIVNGRGDRIVSTPLNLARPPTLMANDVQSFI